MSIQLEIWKNLKIKIWQNIKFAITKNYIKFSILFTVKPHTGFGKKLTLRETVRPSFVEWKKTVSYTLFGLEILSTHAKYHENWSRHLIVIARKTDTDKKLKIQPIKKAQPKD